MLTPTESNFTNHAVFLAQGVILVYDIANRWSFDGIDRWIKEIDEVSDQSRKSVITT